jgi:hypothetical protein
LSPIKVLKVVWNYMHKQIQSSLHLGNGWCHSAQGLFLVLPLAIPKLKS